jgi:hypothetical protein
LARTDFPNRTFSIALVKSSDCDCPGLKVTVRLRPTGTPEVHGIEGWLITAIGRRFAVSRVADNRDWPEVHCVEDG